MRLALVQHSAGENRQNNLDRSLAAIRQAAGEGADLVVFPEIILDRFFPQNACPIVDGKPGAAHLAEPIPGPTTEALMALAKELGIVIVFNLYEVDDQDRYFDSSPVIDADGTLLGVTRMIHITDYEGFHEQDYYHPGDSYHPDGSSAPVYKTRAGKLGVAICYDRHYPEYMRALALAGAELVLIPQAGTLGEWPEGLYEAEVRTAAFQNGYFAALCNRVGVEDELTFSGESFVVAPDGRVLTRGKTLEEDLVLIDLDLNECADSHAKRLFLRDRRPKLYSRWLS